MDPRKAWRLNVCLLPPYSQPTWAEISLCLPPNFYSPFSVVKSFSLGREVSDPEGRGVCPHPQGVFIHYKSKSRGSFVKNPPPSLEGYCLINTLRKKMHL